MLPAPAWGSRDIFRPRPHSLYSSGSGSSFGLREQLHRSGDYFNVKDVRGSSPAASLAADLSQNFRIDNDARFVPCYPAEYPCSSCLLTSMVYQSPFSHAPTCALHCQHDGRHGRQT